MIPIEERVRVLNDLDRSGFYIPNVMGTPPDGEVVDRARLEAALAHLDAAREHLEDVSAAVSRPGRARPAGEHAREHPRALELVELLRGAFKHALSEKQAP